MLNQLIGYFGTGLICMLFVFSIQIYVIPLPSLLRKVHIQEILLFPCRLDFVRFMDRLRFPKFTCAKAPFRPFCRISFSAVL